MNSTNLEQKLCGRDLTKCLRMIEKFHGWKAPGLVLGLFMVDLAQELIGIETEADAIVETRHCLPDAIQLFTPCTVGNGWMKILDWDKFALVLYDRRARNGYRVWFDLVKARRFPNLYNWFMRLVPKKELPLDVLLETILSAGRSVLSSRAIYVTAYYRRQKKSGINVCPVCGEAFASAQGETCWSCQGKNFYEWNIYPKAAVR
jgi:formylmethanofuran dehydrogenase subunit E